MNQPIWTPGTEFVRSTNMNAFRAVAERRLGKEIPNFNSLHRWSISDPMRFWDLVWEWGGIVASRKGSIVAADVDQMLKTRWFPEARLNFAENFLHRRDEAPAIIAWSEARERQLITFRSLYEQVSVLAQALRAHGVGVGDRVVGWLPTIPEAVIAMLATTSLGAVWSSCSPDFGVQGILDRFGQVEPKVLFAANGYIYGGKTLDCMDRLQEIVARLPSLQHTIVIPLIEGGAGAAGIASSTWSDEVRRFQPRPLEFVQLPFDHPVYIMFTSGTTGKPKCLVHGAGGTLLKHVTEHALHFDIKRDDRVYYYTSTGWAMWNWLVTVLARGATMITFDGSPLHPTSAIQFDIVDSEQATLFGTSARFIDSIRKSGLAPAQTHKLTSVRTVVSTGSPLVAENYEYVYSKIKKDVFLSSFSGGTDILGGFVGGDPTSPIWPGEMQAAFLGMDVDVFDGNGKPCKGEKGELVCKRSFPSMPVYFWNDPERARYRQAYFSRFDNIWCQGDFAAITSHGGIVIYGRSDAVLKPGGVRLGTAEIYQQVEKIDEILESVVVGQEWQGDMRVVLFIRLAPGAVLDDALRERIRSEIRRNTTPRHVPHLIVQVTDIPRTMNGKIAEIAVRETIHGRRVSNADSLINPDALRHFSGRPELRA
jgi:acetoacetyl-CoA synthetase